MPLSGPGAAGHLEGDQGMTSRVRASINNSSWLTEGQGKKNAPDQIPGQGRKVYAVNSCFRPLSPTRRLGPSTLPLRPVHAPARPTAWVRRAAWLQYPRASPRRFAPTTGSL